MRPTQARRKKGQRGLTLLELIISVVLAAVVLVMVYRMLVYASGQVVVYMERFAMHSQISNALHDISARCSSANRIHRNSLFSAQHPRNQTSFRFIGEENIRRVTPDDPDDDAEYEYYLRCGGSPCGEGERGALVLKNLDNEKEDVLIEERFRAKVIFNFTADDPDEPMEPNFMKVHISCKSERRDLMGVNPFVEKVQGVRFWFVDVVENRAGNP